MKHKHSELIKRWADNTSLVVLIESGNGEWIVDAHQKHPNWLVLSEYFLACKKHVDVALHWLNCGEVEVCRNRIEGWRLAIKPTFREDAAYRIKKKELIIPWGCMDEKWQYATVDKDGTIVLWVEEPYMIKNHCNQWENDTGNFFEANGILKVDATGIDWKESLTRRPKND